jgi:ADP-ribosylation factor GTPase-activating protein 1
MKVGGNAKARKFFESHPDFQLNWSFADKYNSRTAALYRDKVIFYLIDFIDFLFS